VIGADHRAGLVRVTIIGVLLGCTTWVQWSPPASGASVGTRPDALPRSVVDARERAVPPREDVADDAVAAAAVKRYRSARSHVAAARPVRVTVPSIGVSSGLQPLGRSADGTIEVPGDWQRAGWYRRGPRPGQVGPAVILGHLDSTTGPAVFFRLIDLEAGDEIHVDRADGSVVTFVVERIERHAKTRFPTHDVYLPTLRPTLRLVTCGGAFDATSGHYRDNVVVFAGLAT
jgi:sortase (surface protein transpeptidase)